MSTPETTNSRLSEAILQVMKPSKVYTVQHLAPRLSLLAPSNLEIRAALERLIGDGKIEVAEFFMKSASYRLSAGNAVEPREEIVGYSDSLTRHSALALLARGK